jgi:hypothetical protein
MTQSALEREYSRAVALCERIAGQRDEMMRVAQGWKAQSQLMSECLVTAIQALQLAAPVSMEATMCLGVLEARLEAARDDLHA